MSLTLTSANDFIRNTLFVGVPVKFDDCDNKCLYMHLIIRSLSDFCSYLMIKWSCKQHALISWIRLSSINLIKKSDKEAGSELSNGVFQGM